MNRVAVHEILYRDELGQTARIDPGTTLTKDHEKALAKDMDSLVRRKAVREVKETKEGKTASSGSTSRKSNDGFNDK